MTSVAPPNHWFENTPVSRKMYNWILIILSVVGGLLILLSTSAGGIGTSPDAINYMAAAKSLVNGNGFLRFNSAIPLVHWAPLYPTFLAGIQLISRIFPPDFAETIRFTHAILYSLMILATGHLYLRYLTSHVTALIAIIWVVCGFPILRVTIFAWSEILFTLITVVMVLYWPRIFVPDARLRHFIILGILVTLATLQRFAGYSIVPMVMLSILLFKHTLPRSKRFWVATLFGITSIPVALWLLYGQTTEFYRRVRGDPLDMMLDSLHRTPGLLGEWFLPPELRRNIPNLLILSILLVISCGIYLSYYRIASKTRRYPDLKTYPLLPAHYFLVFGLGLFAAFISVRSPLDLRHVSVLYVFGVLLIFYAIDRLLIKITSQKITRVILAAALVWTSYPIITIYNEVSFLGQSCCMGNQIREVDLIKWLQENPLGPGQYYSNTPLPLIYTDLLAYRSPMYLENWATILDTDQDTYLIWFDDPDPAKRYTGLSGYYFTLDFTMDELGVIADMTLLADLSHGKVYRLTAIE